MVHERTSDVSTFPIECTLEKHAQGFYILSGVCHVCGKTFRATGCIYRAKLSPWAHHKRLQHLIIKHAQTHGAFGYRPQRNLHQMRLDWVLSACNSSVPLDGGVYTTEDTGKLVPSKYKADMESARDQQPKSQQHVLGKSDDDEAVHVTVQSAVPGGLNVPYPSIKHQNTADISTFTFPIACALEKHARGFYILTGVCRLCDKTFRASGGIYQGKAQPWSTHSRLQQQIMKHARTHSAVGYTPHRNLDKMRLDWVQLPSKSSESMADASASRNREVTTFRASDSIYRGKTQPWSTHTRLEHKIIEHGRTHVTAGYTPLINLDRKRLDRVRPPSESSIVMAEASASTHGEITTYCAGCAKWRRTSQFRRGANTCNTCLKIACAACGKEKKQMQYRSQDVYNFLNKKINALCRTCRRKGTKLRVATHKTHKGEHCRPRQCTKCGVYQASSTFRRTKRWQRVDICRTCEVVPCAACGAMLTRENFTDPDIYRYFNSFGAKHITCLVCKKEQQVRQQQLQNIMKRSRRQACTCKHPQAHTQTCPMRIKFDGDRSYPGCDVMSRADSDWLMEQRKKNGWMRAE